MRARSYCNKRSITKIESCDRRQRFRKIRIKMYFSRLADINYRYVKEANKVRRFILRQKADIAKLTAAIKLAFFPTGAIVVVIVEAPAAYKGMWLTTVLIIGLVCIDQLTEASMMQSRSRSSSAFAGSKHVWRTQHRLVRSDNCKCSMMSAKENPHLAQKKGSE